MFDIAENAKINYFKALFGSASRISGILLLVGYQVHSVYVHHGDMGTSL